MIESAKNIKGITIEFGGDTTKLGKALDDVNKQSKGIENELKKVEKALKFDPKNTELLAQKQELLTKAIGSTRDKLDALKQAQDKVNKAHEANADWEKQYEPLKKELSETTKKMSALAKQEQEMKQKLESGKISTAQYDAYRNELETTTQKHKDLMQSQRDLEKQFADGHIDDQQYREYQRTLIETENKLKSLEEQAKQSTSILSKISEGAGKVQSGAQKVASAMTPVTAGIVGFGAAAVASMDAVDEGLDTVATKTGATGEAAKELEGVYREVAATIPADFGDIGAAVGEINTRLDFTGDQLKKSSEDFLKFAKVNELDVNSSVQLVTRAMGDAGISAENYGSVLDMLTVAGQKSGISIDTLSTNLAKYGAPMRALGIDTENAIAMFAGWEKAGVNTETAFSGMKKAISTWGAAGKDSSKEFQKTLDQIKAAPDIATATSMAIEVFGQKAGPDLADAIQGGRFEFEEYIKALDESGGAVESTYGKIVDEVDDTQLAMQNLQLSLHSIGEAIAKTFGPILLSIAQKIKSFLDGFSELSPASQKAIIAIGAIIAAMAPVAAIVGKVAGLVKGLASTFSLLAGGPVLAIAGIVAAIAGLAAIFTHLYKTNEDFRNKVNVVWDQVKQAISGVIASVKEIIQGFVQVVTAIWSKYGQDIMNVVSAAFNVVFSVVNTVLTQVKDVINVIMAVLKGDWQGAWEALKTMVRNLAENIKTIITTWINYIKTIITTVMTAVCDFFKSAWEGMKLAVSNICSAIQNKVVEIFTAIINWFKGLPENLKTIGSDMFAKMKDGVTSTVGNVVSAIKDGINAAIDWIKSIPDQAKTWGKDMIQGIANGIAEAAHWVTEQVEKVAANIRSFLHFSVPDVGPLVDYESWMPDFMQGMADGIAKSKHLVTDAISGLAYDMQITPSIATGNFSGTGSTREVYETVDNSLTLNIDHFNNNRSQDVRELTREALETQEEFRKRMERSRPKR